MKYRHLTFQEFDLLSDDFNEYLYSVGINFYEWRILQDDYSEEAINILGDYSDNIFERMTEDVEYLVFRTSKFLKVIECQESKMISISLKVPNHSAIDLTDFNSVNQLSASDQQVYKCSKQECDYLKDRNHEVFAMIEQGYQVVSQDLFNHLILVRQSFQN